MKRPPPIPQPFKKSRMRDIGILFTIIGFFGLIVAGRLNYTKPPGEGRAIYAMMMDVMFLVLLAGLLMAFLGFRRNRLARRRHKSK